MSAVTDMETIVKYDPTNKPGISNLLEIQSCLTNTPIAELEAKYVGYNYGSFKKEVADVVENFLTDLQAKYNQILADKIIDKVLDDGAQKAHYVARKTLSKVYRRLGLGR